MAINTLNNDFYNCRIMFVWDGNIDYIDDDNLYNDGPSVSVFNMNNHTNGIDIYLLKSDTTECLGLANGIGTGTE